MFDTPARCLYLAAQGKQTLAATIVSASESEKPRRVTTRELLEMKRRGEDLNRHYRQAFDYWTRLVPGRPRYVVLCNFDDFWVYDFETQSL